MSREQRKLDHIKYALKLGDGPLTNGLENVHFVHNCLPELNPQDIVLSSQFGGIFFLSPFLINAVTGGADAVTEINRRLARAAKKAGAAIAGCWLFYTSPRPRDRQKNPMPSFC